MANKLQQKRTKIKGTTDRPRVSVFRSNKFFFVQIIDDSNGTTLVSASSLKDDNGKNLEAAQKVGKQVAVEAKKQSITKVVFDRGRYQYKGRIKVLAESMREEGLEF